MTTEELFEKINKRFDGLEQGQQDLSKRIGTVEKRIGTVENNLSKKIDMVDRKVEVVNKNLGQALHDWADFFQEAGIFFDQMRNKIVERIERIEEHLGIPHKN